MFHADRPAFVLRQAILTQGRVGDNGHSIDMSDHMHQKNWSVVPRFQFLAPKKPQHGKKRHQRYSKKEGTSATMNHAVNHVGTDVHAKQRDHQNTHRVSEKA